MAATGYRLFLRSTPFGNDIVIPNDLEEFADYLHNSPRVSGPPLNYRTEELIREAEITILGHATLILQHAPRVYPHVSYNSRVVDVLRKWSNDWISLSDDDKRHFKTTFLAYRLGITVLNLRASAGLEDFVSNDFTYNTMAFYGHMLIRKDDCSPVQILMDGEYVEWSDAVAKVASLPDIEGLWPWRYGPRGLQKEDLTVWSRADYKKRAFTHIPHPSQGNYLYSICVHYFAGNRSDSCRSFE